MDSHFRGNEETLYVKSTSGSDLSESKKRDAQILDRLTEPIAGELERFRSAYKQALISGHGKIDRIVRYLVRSHGKGLRPILTLLCARLDSDEVDDSAIRAAVIVELLHEATLIHDDVVDESATRRGWPSLPARFKNKVAVLFGDYMLASVLSETLSARDLDWLDILSDTARRMSRGELLQAARSRKLDMNEQDYLGMIGDKTASLFNGCCRLGGLTGGLDAESRVVLGEFGENLGLAFQIRDDLLDLFGDGSGMGKPIGGDLKERKLTLPTIAALSNVSPREARRMKARIRRGVKRKEIGLIAEFVRHNGGEEYALATMRANSKKARDALDKLPQSVITERLGELVGFTMDRTR